MAGLSLSDEMRANAEAFAKTGCLFGLETLARKDSDPGTYEAVFAKASAFAFIWSMSESAAIRRSSS